MPAVSTQHAPAERASAAEIRRQCELLGGMEHLSSLYDAVNEIVVILNAQRQIVFANKALANVPGLGDLERLLGLRPGEALGCVHACTQQGGCGTTEFCTQCGAVNAILASQRGLEDVRDCRVVRGPEQEAFNFLARATPLVLGEEIFSVVALLDTSHEQRRRSLERIFFHDVLNTALSLVMLSDALKRANPERASSYVSSLCEGARTLYEGIVSQRDLAAAESDELRVEALPLEGCAVLDEVRGLYAPLAARLECRLAVSPETQTVSLTSDRRLLGRVVGNMLKNAIEASSPGATITLGCGPVEGGVRFWVHNPGGIPREVQLQLFQRSFSTKGGGRGLGTYSMRLLTERCLKGTVSFTTSAAEGTTFTVLLPDRIG